MNRVTRYIRAHGVVALLSEQMYRITDSIIEQILGIATGGNASNAELGLADSDSRHYSTLPYLQIYAALRALPIDPKRASLVDLGCGKGRALSVAAGMGFSKVTGVEYSELADLARANAERCARRGSQVIVERCDAAHWLIPARTDIFYMYNPFVGQLLASVVGNIERATSESTSPVYVVYFNNEHFDNIVRGASWIEKRRQVRLHDGVDLAIYEIAPRASRNL